MNAFASLSLSAVALALAAAAPLAAQEFDLFGVGYNGAARFVNSTTGAVSDAFGFFPRANAGALDDDEKYWIVKEGVDGIGLGFGFELGFFDLKTRAYTRIGFNQEANPQFNVGDIRALAFVTGLGLVGVRDQNGHDVLVLLNRTNAAVTVIGPTGMNAIQALDATPAGLRAFDLQFGLVNVNPVTGQATDPFPFVGAQGESVQWMTTDRATNVTYAGNTRRFVVDHSTGNLLQPIAIGCAGCNHDFRALDALTFRQTSIGTPCGSGAALRSQFVAAPTAHHVDTLRTTSFPHQPGVLGLRIVGLSDEFSSGLALPFSLDPVLGTVGCRLYVSLDVTTPGFASSAGELTFSMPVPNGASWLPIFVQHVALDPVAGGMTWTNGVRARTGL